jgi:AcrR family transcriptional regulator
MDNDQYHLITILFLLSLILGDIFMVRKKVYTRDQILRAAYDLVLKEGFSNFTARHVSSSMGISTQPIYLEFQNMDDLKENLLDKIFTELFTVTLRKKYTKDPLVDLGIAFVNFARDNRKLFHTLFVNNSHCGQKMYNYSLENFRELVKTSEKYHDLSEMQITFLHYRSWIIATGLAVLTSSGVIQYSKEKLEKVFSSTITSLLNNPKFMDPFGFQ